mmetsp:Transcript_55696/g.178705  ORF Transcript_55696/g.178705 Transcript_55696/m.178705 type:complete len:242 (+) Transcript_55696:1600-2325(+)
MAGAQRGGSTPSPGAVASGGSLAAVVVAITEPSIDVKALGAAATRGLLKLSVSWACAGMAGGVYGAAALSPGASLPATVTGACADRTDTGQGAGAPASGVAAAAGSLALTGIGAACVGGADAEHGAGVLSSGAAAPAWAFAMPSTCACSGTADTKQGAGAEESRVEVPAQAIVMPAACACGGGASAMHGIRVQGSGALEPAWALAMQLACAGSDTMEHGAGAHVLGAVLPPGSVATRFAWA